MNIILGVIIGQGYSTIAWIPEAQGSWALPLLHERISSASSPILQAASQLKLVCEQSINPVLAVLDARIWQCQLGTSYSRYSS
ncbi:hypothetical protein QUA35_26545 [Microcoleus sp. N9_B2]|uniref:hypothetical protein n=1 Tax=unclassified Microcoleus TaxID=2642155 RepID=UPI002FD6B51E